MMTQVQKLQVVQAISADILLQMHQLLGENPGFCIVQTQGGDFYIGYQGRAIGPSNVMWENHYPFLKELGFHFLIAGECDRIGGKFKVS